MSQRIPIPRHLDDSQQVLFVSMEEFVLLLIGLFLGVLIEAPIMSLMLCIALIIGMRRQSSSQPDGLIVHMIYWSGIVPTSFRSTPNPFIRRIPPA